MFEKRILNIYSIVIGVLFIVSGIGKVIDTSSFSMLIYQYGLGYLMILSPLIALFEILIGIFLVLLINPRRYSIISFILLIIFTISFAYAYFKNGVTDCGCFGTIQHTNLPPIFSFIRNFILIVMALIIWLKFPKEKTKITRWKKYIIVSLMSISIFTAGLTYQIPYFLRSKKEIHKFQNKNINDTELSKYITTSPDSSYLIFCFSYTCSHCWNSIENLRQFKKINLVDSVISFVTGETQDKLIFNQNFKPDFNINELADEKMSELANAFPTAYYVEDDTIKVIVVGELPSPFTFIKTYKLLESK